MQLQLKDPRQYSTIIPESNMLLTQAQQELADNSNNNQLLVALIEDMLAQGQDQLLSVAYNLAPSQEVADRIWQALQQAINAPSALAAKSARWCWFALPLILVLGSSEPVQLANSLLASELRQVLLKHQVINREECCILPQLFDPEGLARLRPSWLYQCTTETDVERLITRSGLTNHPIQHQGEQVYLRFILGAYPQAYYDGSDDAHLAPVEAANFGRLGMELAQLVGSQLATPGATLFALPFAPLALSAALVEGNRYCAEIAISLHLSNSLKQLRLAGKAVEVKLASHNNSIQIELWAEGSTQPQQRLSWPIQRADDFTEICARLGGLLQDMQLPINYDISAVASATSQVNSL